MKIIIGFSHKKGFRPIDYLIQWFQKDVNFSHAYIRFYDSYTDNFMIIEARKDVHMQELSNWEKRNKSVHEFQLEITDERKREILKFAYKNLKKPYSYKNLIGIILNRFLKIEIFKDESNAYICSELVATIFQNELKFSKPLDYVTPKDIYLRIKNG